MSEHTKTPWEVEGMTLCVISNHAPKGRMRVADIRGWGYLTGKGEGALGLSDDEAFSIQEANADFIVKAVNSHDALVNALSEIIRCNKEFRGGMPEQWEGDPLQDVCDEAEKILKTCPVGTSGK